MHNGRCTSSSPMRDGTSPAGKSRVKSLPQTTPNRDLTPDVRVAERSPANAELPKGRRVLVDKNAPSDHWMANPSSNIQRNIKYDWQCGKPEIEWKRHVPSAIPVEPKASKRLADPQGRPWVRQFPKLQKNAPSDPLAFEPGWVQCPRSEPEARVECPDKGKRFYAATNNLDSYGFSPRHDGCSPLRAPNLDSSPGLSPRRAANLDSSFGLSPRSDWDRAGLESRCRDGDSEASPLYTKATRRQYHESHRNRPSDTGFSSGACYWEERTTPRSASPDSRRSPTPLKRVAMPGESGMSPITSQRRPHCQRPESPMWRP